MGTNAATAVVQYSPVMGYVYMANLIVGTGALALPKAFQNAGYILGIVILVVLAFFSYLNMSFMLESMSLTNAMTAVALKVGDKRKVAISYISDDEDRETSGTADSGSENKTYTAEDFEIVRRIEMGDMATMLLGNVGRIAFYFCMLVYLFGDLAIYAAVVPKSMMNAICTYVPDNLTNDTNTNVFNLAADEPCWPNTSEILTRMTVYRLLVGVFAITLGPFNFMNLSRTKYLQIITSAFRWSSFIIMILWALILLAQDGPRGYPAPANGNLFTNLFGVSVYSFMCHHSLPGMVTPMKNKKHFFPFMVGVFTVIFMFYSLLSLTGAFAFADVDDVYTLTFFHVKPPVGTGGIAMRVLQYLLVLFPVFTISTNYPIIGTTLRNNLDTLLFERWRSPGDVVASTSNSNECQGQDAPWAIPSESNPAVDKIGVSTEQLVSSTVSVGAGHKSKWTMILRRVVLPLVITVLPLVFSLLTFDVTLLAAITGSYPGVGVQYILPSWLSFAVRRKLHQEIRLTYDPPYASPFKGFFWVYLSFFWAVCTVGVVTANYIIQNI